MTALVRGSFDRLGARQRGCLANADRRHANAEHNIREVELVVTWQETTPIDENSTDAAGGATNGARAGGDVSYSEHSVEGLTSISASGIAWAAQTAVRAP